MKLCGCEEHDKLPASHKGTEYFLRKKRWLHNLLHSMALLRIRYLFSEEEKKSISAKFIHGFLRSMQVHSEGLSGTQFIPVNVFEGELPLMLFSLPLRSKSISELSWPASLPHTRNFPPVLTVTHKAPGQQRGWRLCRRRLMWGKDCQTVLNLTYPLSGSFSLELIVNPIKAGNTAYWFTPLNTHNKQIQREYIMCKFTHKWLSHPRNIHINHISSHCTPLYWPVRWKNSCSSHSLNWLQPL